MCFIPDNDNILDHQFKKLTVCAKLLRSCSTLCSPMECSLPGSSVHGILQARILEWVAISSPGDLSDPGIEPGSPALQPDSFFFFFIFKLYNIVLVLPNI